MSYLIQPAEDLEHLSSNFQEARSTQHGVQPSSDESPNLFALTIGINSYRNSQYVNLKGCVSDADDVEEYLQLALAVPKAHIKSLRDGQATRESIIQAIKAFMVDSRIKEGNPILIYFAGHGAEANAPEGWPSEDSKTQMLIPHDCGDAVNGKTIHGIPDRTLGWLLKQLADEKGQNITVVLDNCFSGSGTRTLNTESEESIRGVDYQFKLPPELDRQIHSSGPTPRGIQATPEFLRGGFKSHVLLAACGAGELAREIRGRGAFTEALLATLGRLAIERVTYHQLMFSIPNLGRQNPQCEGEHQHNPIFRAMAPRRHSPTVYQSFLKSTTLTIKAGSAHGVTKGSRFSLWKDYSSLLNKDLPLTIITVTKVQSFSSEAIVEDSQLSTPSFVAVQVKSGQTPELFLHVPYDECMKPAHQGVLRVMQNPNMNVMNIVLSSPEKANINISHEPDGFYFIINNPVVNRHGLKRLPHSLPLNADAIEFHRIFHALAHYEYHLQRSNVRPITLGGLPLVQKVFLEIFKVRKFERTDELDSPEIEGDNLNDIVKGIDVILDDSWYLFKIRNESKLDLYPALFYFDNCDLSINSLYQSPTAGSNSADHPLKAGQSLTIGYGAGGGVPYIFDIRGTHAIELGFLKLFLTSQYVDFSTVEQVSPFINARAMTRYHKESNFWDTIVVPVIVRRPSSTGPPAENVCLNSPVSEGNTFGTALTSPDLGGCLSSPDNAVLDIALQRLQGCEPQMETLQVDIAGLSLTKAATFDN
ncbi:hypothetical protein GALMADRAFT_157880 [Galerina marginata CBS 339.88]|uniref:Peptidase C14 caspase domain-containing protein n=1 Tax=Galerina marginata (strain CBS 339.88) TaxID=685588 RepID=A0A067T2D3_GALM3|nr:hypothetical protein GALMADRAFT_157880 [Galerina marginata CBS 339.88]